jgi:D-aminopeptidase
MSPSLGVAQARLQAATREGLAKLGAMEPYRIEGTVEVGIRLRTRSVAEWLTFLPEVERTDAFSIRYHAADIVAASRFLMFVTFAKSAVS